MKTILLMLRVEIACIFVLLFLLTYYTMFKVKDKEYFFLKLSCIALSHVIFEACQVIAMIYKGIIDELTSLIVYIGFYATGIAFVVWFFTYVVRRLAHYKHSVLIKVIGYVLLALYVAALALLPLNRAGVRHDASPLEEIMYGIFLLYCTVCTVILMTKRTRAEIGTKLTLLPVVIIMYLIAVLQAFFPEMHLTGGGLTIICVALFATLDNPDKDFTKQALWDFSTGLKNRNSYNRDLLRFTDHSFRKKPRTIGFLVADMNHLKATNDHFGHIEGDKLLEGAATVLREQLKSAEDIYRLGGDEFVAIYLSVDDRVVEAEMANVIRVCEKDSKYATPLSFAMGYATGSTNEDIDAIFCEADRRMYENKAHAKDISFAPLTKT